MNVNLTDAAREHLIDKGGVVALDFIPSLG